MSFFESVGKILNYVGTEVLKDQGCKLLEEQKYPEAIDKFSGCISLAPDSSVHSYRAEAYYRMEMYKEAIDDCKCAIALTPSNAKAYFLTAECFLKLGNLPQAETYYKNAISYGIGYEAHLQNLRRIMADVNAAYQLEASKDYSSCLNKILQAELFVTKSLPLVILKAKALSGLQRNWEVLTITENILSMDENNMDAIRLRDEAKRRLSTGKTELKNLAMENSVKDKKNRDQKNKPENSQKNPKDKKAKSKPPQEKPLKAQDNENSQKIPKDQNPKSLQDCPHFIAGNCKYGEKCYKRHCEAAKAQSNTCFKWESPSCTNFNCKYRHPKLSTETVAKEVKEGHVIGYFWDYENCPVGKQTKIFDVVQKLRNLNEKGAKEIDFTCFCNVATLPESVRISLHQCNVRLQDIPDKKPNAVDRAISLALTKFQGLHKNATLVLISGDIDFVNNLADMRYRMGYNVISVHNAQAKQELIATATSAHPWTDFVGETKKPKNNTKNKTKNNMSTGTKFSFVGWNWNCMTCKEDFSDLTAVQQHQDAKGHARASCYCGVGNLSNSELKEHKTTSRHWKCDSCENCFQSEDACLAHIQSTSHYCCQYCRKKFEKEESYVSHVRSLLGRKGHSKLKSYNITVSAESDSDSEEDEKPDSQARRTQALLARASYNRDLPNERGSYDQIDATATG